MELADESNKAYLLEELIYPMPADTDLSNPLKPNAPQ